MMPKYMPMQDLTRQQDVSGVPPMYQNIANQQAIQNMAMQQGQGLTQQAGQIGQQGGGMNPMAMAMMLRRQPNQQQMNANDVQMGGMRTYNPFTQFDISNTYGTNPYSQQSRMLASQEF
jgi:hypothetical protein